MESILQSPKGLLEVEDIAIAIYMITLLLFIGQAIMVTLNHCELFSFVIEKYQFPFTLIFRESNGDITSFMKRRNWTDYDKLESFYVEKLLKIVDNLEMTPMGKWVVLFIRTRYGH